MSWCLDVPFLGMKFDSRNVDCLRVRGVVHYVDPSRTGVCLQASTCLIRIAG